MDREDLGRLGQEGNNMIKIYYVKIKKTNTTINILKT